MTTDEDELERWQMAHSKPLQAILDAAHERIQQGHGLSAEEFWARVKERSAERQVGRKHSDGRR